MPTLRSHTHLQAAQAKTQIQSLQKSMPAQTHGRQNRCSKNERNITRKMNNETLTSCIVHLADSANIKGITSNKLCSGLTGLCFDSPNDTIHVTVICHSALINTINNVFKILNLQFFYFML